MIHNYLMLTNLILLPHPPQLEYLLFLPYLPLLNYLLPLPIPNLIPTPTPPALLPQGWQRGSTLHLAILQRGGGGARW